MGTPASRTVRLVVALTSLWCPAALRAQPLVAPVAAGNGADVYLNDSFEASDAITKARALAHQGRWGEAAHILVQTTRAEHDKVVRATPGAYVGLRAYIADLIAAWPPAGINAYREAAGPAMRDALTLTADSVDSGELLTLFEQYFCTAEAAALADRIGQLAIESGDPALAQRVYRKVVAVHPDRVAYSPRYQAMLAVIEAVQTRRIPEIPADADSTIRWMGQELPLAEALRQAADVLQPANPERARTDWPIFAGNNARDASATTRVDELGLLWRVDVAAEGANSRHPRESGEAVRTPALTNLRLTPVIADELVFVQSFRQVRALRLSTGAAVWHFDADGGPAALPDDWEERPAGWDSVTVSDGRVYAALPTDADPYYGTERSERAAAIVCLDANSGREIWRADRRTLGDPSAEVAFDSSPVVNLGRVYVVGRRRRSFGFEDCYLYALRAADGRVEFRTHLGSASTGTLGARQPTTTMPALHGDSVYVNTNLGSVAAVSAHTGSVRWLRLYPRNLDRVSDGSTWSVRDVPPWSFNPVVVHQDRVICLPTDSRHVYALAVDDGRILASIPASDMGEIQTIVGVKGDVLCGVGREVGCYDLKQSNALWSEPLGESERVTGRAVWADDQLWLPTAASLARIDVPSGRRTDWAWEFSGRGGNLVALADQLVVGGEGTVSLYVRKSDMWTALRKRMDDAPTDPIAALELTEVAVRGGETRTAFEALAEAVRRADLQPPDVESPSARRIYDDVFLVLTALTRDPPIPIDQLDSLALTAARFAPDVEAHLEHRVRFAEAYAAADKPAESVRLLQQVLRDRSLRELAVAQPDGGTKRGAELARQAIDELIAARGRTVYAAFDEEARRLLDTAVADNDLPALARVVEGFPNSEAAAQSLLSQADLLLKSARPDEAAKRLTQAFHRYGNAVDRPALLQRIAEAHHRAGRPEHAYRWLSRAAREFPNQLVDYDGNSITFLQYRERLADARGLVEPPRPAINLPLENAVELDLPDGAALLSPRFPVHAAHRWSSYFVATHTAVEAFDSRTARSRWTEPARTRAPVELLASTDELTIFITLYEVFALRTATGVRAWSYGEYPTRLKDDNADWEDGLAIRAYDLDADRIVFARDNGELTCLAANSGEVLWTQRHRPAPVSKVWLQDAWVVYPVLNEGESMICLVDAATGSWVDGVPSDERRPIEQIFTPIDGQLIVMTSQSMASLDLDGRKWQWRVAFGGHVRRPSVLFDVDVVYLSDDGVHLQKYNLEDGKPAWETDRIVPRGSDDLSVERIGGTLVVSTTSGLTAIDGVDGRVQWEATTPPRARFMRRIVTKHYVAALDVPAADALEADSAVYFYDHRNASGVIPRDGGVKTLGRLNDVRGVIAVDGAIIVQNGGRLLAWREAR